MVSKIYEQIGTRTATAGHERIANNRRGHHTSPPKLKLPESKTILWIGAAALVVVFALAYFFLMPVAEVARVQPGTAISAVNSNAARTRSQGVHRDVSTDRSRMVAVTTSGPTPASETRVRLSIGATSAELISAPVLLAIRWSSHSFGDVRQFCERHGKPLVRLQAGYHPNQVALQIVSQCSGRLTPTS